MTVIERFLKYVSFDTQSDENSGATPSTPKQMVFAQYLRSELEQLGFQEISLDENGYPYWPAMWQTDNHSHPKKFPESPIVPIQILNIVQTPSASTLSLMRIAGLPPVHRSRWCLHNI